MFNVVADIPVFDQVFYPGEKLGEVVVDDYRVAVVAAVEDGVGPADFALNERVG